MKILKKKTTFEGSDKKQHTTYNFYLKLDNGVVVPIKPTFKNGYTYLMCVAEYVEDK